MNRKEKLDFINDMSNGKSRDTSILIPMYFVKYYNQYYSILDIECKAKRYDSYEDLMLKEGLNVKDGSIMFGCNHFYFLRAGYEKDAVLRAGAKPLSLPYNLLPTIKV